MRQEVERARGLEGGETVVVIHCVREESVFKKKETKKFWHFYGDIN